MPRIELKPVGPIGFAISAVVLLLGVAVMALLAHAFEVFHVEESRPIAFMWYLMVNDGRERIDATSKASLAKRIFHQLHASDHEPRL